MRFGPKPSRWTSPEFEPGPPFQRNVSGRAGAPGARSSVYATKNMLRVHVAGVVVANRNGAGPRGVAQDGAADRHLMPRGDDGRRLRDVLLGDGRGDTRRGERQREDGAHGGDYGARHAAAGPGPGVGPCPITVIEAVAGDGSLSICPEVETR